MFFQKTRLWLWAAMIVGLVMLYGALAHAQLPSEVDETSVAITFNEIAGNRGWGALGAVPFKNGHVSAIAQGGGNVVRGKYHAEINFPVGVGSPTPNVFQFKFKVFTDGVFKGPTVRDLGRQADVGLAIEVQLEHGNAKFPISIGVFGRNAGPFGPPNARDDLENLGYDPNALDGRDLETLHPPPSGLSFKAGNSVNLLLSTEVHLPYDVSLGVRLMPELAGAGDNPVHQLIITPSTSFELRDNINLEIGADFGLQTFNDAIETELATLAAVKLSF